MANLPALKREPLSEPNTDTMTPSGIRNPAAPNTLWPHNLAADKVRRQQWRWHAETSDLTVPTRHGPTQQTGQSTVSLSFLGSVLAYESTWNRSFSDEKKRKKKLRFPIGCRSLRDQSGTVFSSKRRKLRPLIGCSSLFDQSRGPLSSHGNVLARDPVAKYSPRSHY